eukprot:1328220-Pleurochrysis_carterae.AAC.1
MWVPNFVGRAWCDCEILEPSCFIDEAEAASCCVCHAAQVLWRRAVRCRYRATLRRSMQAWKARRGEAETKAERRSGSTAASELGLIDDREAQA